MEKSKISNRQTVMMVLDRLHKENKKDSALRLTHRPLQGISISLDTGDIDWDIDTAIRQCGGESSIGYRYTAYSHFNRKTEMVKERYDEIAKELHG